jgi:hypothetical protein
MVPAFYALLNDATGTIERWRGSLHQRCVTRTTPEETGHGGTSDRSRGRSPFDKLVQVANSMKVCGDEDRPLMPGYGD